MSKPPSTIGQQIRAAREAKGMTAEEFARALGVPWRRMVAWEERSDAFQQVVVSS
jgi:transcriptional regulator with XRE-family HTH domain